MPFLAGRRGGLAAAAICLGLAVPAGAAELATASDGSIEVRAAQKVIARVSVKTPPMRRGTPALREITVEGHPVAEVRVPVRGTSAQETWVADLGAKPPRVIWSGITGARDLDEEVAVHLDVSSDRIIEYQTAAQVTRCDGETPHLFPRAWDFGSARFRPVLSPLPAPADQKLVARRGDPAMPAGRSMSGFHWTGASTTAAAGGDARGLTAPSTLNDGDPATVWAEGLGGDGRGEFLTARSTAGGYAVRGLRILPGDASSEAAFRGKNRVRRFLLALGPRADQRFDVEIAEDPAADKANWRQAYWVALPKPIESSCVTVVLTELVRGSEAAPPKNYGTTAISDIDIFTDLDGPAGAERLVADIAKGANCGARIPLLVSLGEPAVFHTTQALLVARGGGRECLVEALAQLVPEPKNPIVTDALAAALVGATATEERLVTATLRRAEPPPIRALDQLLGGANADPEDRSRAARVLGALDRDAAVLALLAAAGRGPTPVRVAVVQALGGSPALKLDALLAAIRQARSEAPPRHADLLRALPSAAKRNPQRRAEVLAVLRDALAPTGAFEVRARAVMALGDLRSSEGVADLTALRAGSEEAVLRYLATRELVAIGGGQAIVALRAALADKDPRAREVAALGLGHHQDQTSGAAIIQAAKQEPWPFVRRAELDALGRLCVPGTGDLMIRASERDVDEVRRTALAALVRCRDARSKTVLLHTLGRRNEAATLRELAAALLGELGDKSAAPPMAAALKRLVNESEADIALEGVAASTLRGLSRLGGPEAVSMAVALADDTRHPFRHTAIEALGTLCDPGAGASTLRRLVAGPGPTLAAAAQTAQRRCAIK